MRELSKVIDELQAKLRAERGRNARLEEALRPFAREGALLGIVLEQSAWEPAFKEARAALESDGQN